MDETQRLKVELTVDVDVIGFGYELGFSTDEFGEDEVESVLNWAFGGQVKLVEGSLKVNAQDETPS
jgi:hypothetical protein